MATRIHPIRVLLWTATAAACVSLTAMGILGMIVKG